MEKQTMSEMLKQLGEQQNAERLSINESATSLKNLLTQIHQIETNLIYRNDKSLAEFEEKLAPLAEAMSKLINHTKEAQKEMNNSIEGWTEKSKQAFHLAESAGQLIASQAKRLTVKMWCLMCLIGILSAPLTVFVYSNWQHRLTEEKAQALEWRNFKRSYEKLSNFQKSMFQKMFGWTPGK